MAADGKLTELLKDARTVVGVVYGFPYALKMLVMDGKSVYLAGVYPQRLSEAGYKSYDYSFKPDAVIMNDGVLVNLDEPRVVECIEQLKGMEVTTAYVVAGVPICSDGLSSIEICEDGSGIYSVELDWLLEMSKRHHSR